MVALAVFGSYARGEPRFDLDLDSLLVPGWNTWSRLSERTEEFVVNIEQPRDEYLQRLCEAGISKELSPVILTRNEAQNSLPFYPDEVSRISRELRKDRELA